MTPKEKAKELFDKMSSNIDGYGWGVSAKECTIIAVDEIIYVLKIYGITVLDGLSIKEYWNEVKKEINKL